MIADFLSKPVLVGYMTGAALILVSTQLEKALRREAPRARLLSAARRARRQAVARRTYRRFALGIGFLAMLGVLHRRRAPAAGRAGGLRPRHRRLGGLRSRRARRQGRRRRAERTAAPGAPRDLGAPTSATCFPARSASRCSRFRTGSSSRARSPNKNGYDVQPEHELRALAAANLAAGLFQGFPVGASQSRTAVNDAAGGRTQLASLVAAAALVPFLLLLTPLLRLLPMVALGAIVVFAGAQLVDLDQYARLYRIAPSQLRQRAARHARRAGHRRRARDRRRRHAVADRAPRSSRAAGGRRPAAGAGDRELP